MVTQNTSLTKPVYGSIRNLLTIMNHPALSPPFAFSFRSLAPTILILFLFTPYAYSAIINASSCSPTDIQTAVNSARTGDRVQLPACTNSSWGTQTVKIYEAIAIAGAGENQTILIKPDVVSEVWRGFFHVDCSGWVSGHFEFYGITLQGRGDEQTLDKGMDLRNACKDFIIHDSTFRNFGHAGIYIRDAEFNSTGRGLIYNNKFIDNYRVNRGYGVHVVGDGNYSLNVQLGTQNAVFVENNYFKGSRHTIASNNGSHYVFRYNTIVDNREDAAAIDAHGKVIGWPRGSNTYEIYNNSIVNSIRRWAGAGIRGGDGVIFNNTMSGTDNPIMLFNDSSLSYNDGCTTYPCPDQIRELYIWNNTQDGKTANVSRWKEIDKLLIQEGRDYFLYPRPGYTPYPYPHPLAVQSDDSQPPAAPAGLKILP